MRNINVKQERITNRASESFKLYLEEIREYPRLTADEENELAIKVTKGDKDAIDKLIKCNLRFVVSVAKQYVTPEFTLQDLVNEGNIGLIEATKTFNPTKGFKFITYAVWWIRKMILMSLGENGLSIRLPHNKLTMLNKIRNEYNYLEQVLNRQPSLYELLEEVTIKYDGKYEKKDVQFFFENNTGVMSSLDKSINHEGETEFTLQDLISDTTYDAPDKNLTDNDTNFHIELLLGRLKNEKERNVIKLLYGLDGNEPMGLKEVGEILEISRERVRQIKEKSLLKMRESIAKIY